jgi:hypothetical protein
MKLSACQEDGQIRAYDRMLEKEITVVAMRQNVYTSLELDRGYPLTKPFDVNSCADQASLPTH